MEMCSRRSRVLKKSRRGWIVAEDRGKWTIDSAGARSACIAQYHLFIYSRLQTYGYGGIKKYKELPH
jgi:hypothetical protein